MQCQGLHELAEEATFQAFWNYFLHADLARATFLSAGGHLLHPLFYFWRLVGCGAHSFVLGVVRIGVARDVVVDLYCPHTYGSHKTGKYLI
jgi:hypothetical protein